MKPLLLLALLLTGCFRVSVLIPTVQPAERHGKWINGWLWGLVGGEESVDRFCGNRLVAKIETKRNVGNYLVSWLTLGIYTPSKLWVTCGQGYQNYGQGGGQPVGGYPVPVPYAQPYAVPQPAPYAQPPQPPPPPQAVPPQTPPATR